VINSESLELNVSDITSGVRMKIRRLVVCGVFAGFGLGLLLAWSIFRDDCPSAPGLIAIFDYGIGSSVLGVVMLILTARKPSSS